MCEKNIRVEMTHGLGDSNVQLKHGYEFTLHISMELSTVN